MITEEVLLVVRGEPRGAGGRLRQTLSRAKSGFRRVLHKSPEIGNRVKLTGREIILKITDRCIAYCNINRSGNNLPNIDMWEIFKEDDITIIM